MGRKGKGDAEAFSGDKKLRWDLWPLMARHKIKTATELSRLLSGLGLDFSSIYLSRIIDTRPSLINSSLLDGLVCLFNCTASDILVIEPYEGGPSGDKEPSDETTLPKKVPQHKPANKQNAQKKPVSSENTGKRGTVNFIAEKSSDAASDVPKKNNVTHLHKRKTQEEIKSDKVVTDFLDLPSFVLPPENEE